MQEKPRTEGKMIMRLALVNDVRCEPAPKFRGKCCLCGSDMISKCGEYVRWHWAHKTRMTCDPWQESETDWHRYWKDAFPFACQEVVHIDRATNERHIADVKTPGGFVVEVQHSPIAEKEARIRERIYNRMIWIVDARHLSGWFSVGMAYDLESCCPMMYQIEWWGPSRLLDKWSNSPVHVYLDVMNSANEHGDEDGKLWFLPRETIVPVEKRVLWRLLEFDAADRTGYIAPVQAEAVIEAVMNGDFPPLHECKEEDAWRYRRELREVAGHIDNHGNKIPSAISRRSNFPIDHTRSERSHTPIDDDDLPF